MTLESVVRRVARKHRLDEDVLMVFVFSAASVKQVSEELRGQLEAAHREVVEEMSA